MKIFFKLIILSIILTFNLSCGNKNKSYELVLVTDGNINENSLNSSSLK